MNQALRVTCALLLTFAGGAALAQGEKVHLLYKAKVGEVVRHQSTGAMKMSAAGQTANMDVKEVQKVTFTQVLPNGDLIYEQEAESTEISINGRKMPPNSNKDKTTIHMTKVGNLVKFTESSAEKDDQDHIDSRLFVATNIVFPDRPVGVGDKWTIEYKANTEAGSRAGKADFEALASEKIGDVETFKIKMAFKESEGATPISATSTVWVEKTSGDGIKSEYDVTGVQFNAGGITQGMEGKMSGERLSGTPLGGGKTAVAAKPKTIDDVVKDYTKIPGIFTLWKKTDQGRDTIYLEMREDQLNKLHMLEVTASTGNAMQVAAGDPLNDIVFKFVKRPDEKIAMVVPNYGFRAPEGTPIERAVKRSFPEGIIEAFKIEGTHPERKSILINFSDFFKGDTARVTDIWKPGGGVLGSGGGGYMLDRDKTYVASIKNFPENMVVDTEYHFTRGAGPGIPLQEALQGGPTTADPRSMPLRVSYYLFELKDTGYKPRLADPRVGFFSVDYQDFADDGAWDQKVRNILRWDIQKADPKAAMSPPTKPIVFWLDNAIPVQYREAVADGIKAWNKAFEKIGIKDAIVTKQMPDDADWDHADMRYNLIRWVASPNNGYAVALFRINPMTGQILNANITVDANLVRSIKLERKQRVEPAAFFSEGLERDPSAALKHSRACNMAEQAMEQAWFGHTALTLAGVKVNEKEYINSFLRYVIAHEMGHLMGLYHNFIASTQHTMSDLANPAKVRAQGVSASVMDYVAFNVQSIRSKADYWSQTVGPYDLWAIKYGYLPIDATTPKGELYELKRIASQNNLPGHAFQNDLMADSFDPCVVRWDVSGEPLAYWEKIMNLSKFLMKNLAERSPKKGESFYEFTRDFNGLLNNYARGAAVASRYIGGMHVNRNHKGDAGEKPTLVATKLEDQKKALQLLNTYVFAENAFNFPASAYGKFTTDPFPDIVAMLTSNPEFPIRDNVAGIQRAALNRLFNPTVLRRMVNNEFRMGGPANALTLPYLFNSVGNTVWSEAASMKNVSTLRRQLQRAHLATMVDMVTKPSGATPEDARMLAWNELRTLKARLNAAKSATYDDYTRVHLDESLMQINRALDAKVMIGSQSSGGGNLLQMLMGGSESKPATK